jgi:predicted nuclease of predicted toxin-antitoxin system
MDSLRRQGFEVLRLKDFVPMDSPDQLVISAAQKNDAILVSLNGDFTDIVTYPPGKYKGIIALQVRNHPATLENIIKRLIKYLSENPQPDHYLGKLFLVEAHRIRIRE